MGNAKGTFDPNGEGSSDYCFKRPRNSHSGSFPVLCLLRLLVPTLRGPSSYPKAAHQCQESVGVAAPGLRSWGLSRGNSPGLRPTAFLPRGKRARSSPGAYVGPRWNRFSFGMSATWGKRSRGRSARARFSTESARALPQKDGPREPARSPRRSSALALGGGDRSSPPPSSGPATFPLKRRNSKRSPRGRCVMALSPENFDGLFGISRRCKLRLRWGGGVERCPPPHKSVKRKCPILLPEIVFFWGLHWRACLPDTSMGCLGNRDRLDLGWGTG